MKCSKAAKPIQFEKGCGEGRNVYLWTEAVIVGHAGRKMKISLSAECTAMRAALVAPSLWHNYYNFPP